MATNGGEIKFKVGFDVNKAGLDNLEKTLSHLKSELGKQIDFSKSLKTDKANKELVEVQTTINEVQKALKNSFNSDLGVMNVAKLNSALKNIGIEKIQKDFSTMGAAGQIAFKNLATQTMTTNMQLKQTHNIIDKMATTLGNTLKWNISAGAINRMTGAIQQAWGFTKSLDNSLNDIMIVTGKSADEMERFSRQANKAAKELSAGTTDYTKASLIYYQQGLSDEEVAARAETTIKVANVTGQSTDTVSQNLTAVWNGYKVSAEEAELYIDKLSAVAATTAADLDGLSTGMSKVASAANLMGVDVDQLNATLATVISVTQQAPESVGTAFKTIYARMGDIEAGLDTETTLGEYTSKVKEIAGVNVLDANNQLRDMGEVIEEIGGKWTTLSREQQIALSQAMAGTRQYNNLLSLFDNWDMYTDALNESANAAGTLQEQQEIYQQTVEASLKELRTTFESLYMELFDAETIKDMVDMLTSVMEKVESFVKAIGGGGNALSALGAIATRVFSKQIAQGIATTITNFKIAKDNTSQLAAQMEAVELFGGRQNIAGGDAYLQKLTEMKKSVLDLGNLVTAEQHEQANSIIKTTNELQNQKIAYDESIVQAQQFLQNNKKYSGKGSGGKPELYNKIDDKGNIDYTENFDISSVDKANKALKAIEDRIESSNDAILRAKIAIKEYSNSIEDNGKQHEKTKQTLGKAVEKIKEEISSIQTLNSKLPKASILYKEYGQKIEEATKAYDKALASGNKKAILRTGQELLDVQTEVNQKMSIEAEKTGKAIAAQAEQTGQKLQKNIKEAENQWKNFIHSLQTVRNIQSFVQILGGINQITSGLRSLWNITEILNNEELSGGEKALQIISALSMGLSMFISGTLSVVTLLPILTGLIEADTIATLKNIYTKEGLGAVMKKVAIKGVKKLGEAFRSTTGMITLSTIAIMGAIAIWSHITEKQNEAIRKQEELNRQSSQAKIENIKKQQEEIQSVDELISSYMDLYNVYKNTGDASSEFLTTKNQIIETLGLEGAAIANLTGDYKSLTIEMLKAKGAQAETKKDLAWESMVENEKLLASNMFTKETSNADNLENALRIAGTFGYSIYSNSAVLAQNDRGYIQFDPGALKYNEIDIEEYFKEVGIKYEDAADFGIRIYQDQYETAGDVIDLYEKLLEVNKQVIEDKKDDKDSDEYEALLDIINNEDLKNFYNEYNKQKEIYADALAESKLYNSETIDKLVSMKNQKDYQEVKKSVEKIVDEGKDYEKLTDAEKVKKVDELLAEALGADTVQTMENRVAFTNQLTKQYFNDKLGPGNIPQGMGRDTAKAYFNKTNEEISTIEDTLSELSDEEFSAFTTIVNVDRLKSMEVLDAYVEYAKAYAKAQEIELKISVTEDLANSLKEGKELTNEQKESLEKLEAEYPMLQAIQDKTSKEYIKNLLQIQQHLEEQKIATEEAATGVLIQYALELDVNTDEFEETMKDIAEQQYEVLVAVKADIQSDFDNLVDNMTDIDDMASKIGDDFTVAASDIEELNDIFPGILANMELTEDGSVRLNSTIAKEAIEAAKMQIKADTAATVEKLNNQAKEMEVKRDAAKAIAKQLREGYDGEKLTDEAKQTLTKNLAIFQSSASAEIAEQEQTDNKNVAESSAQAAENMVTNYATAYEQMSRDAVEWAKIAQDALKASTDANVELPTMPGDYEFGTKDGKALSFATTVAINESEIPDLDALNAKINKNDEGLSQEEADRLAEYFDNLAESYNEAANNTYGKIAEAIAREQEEINGLNNIQSGKGKDGQKSKDEIDYLDKKLDLYREVNLELAKQEKLLNKLQKQQDKLNGKDLIDNLNEQLFVIEKQKQALIEKASIAKKEAQAHRENLETQGVQFNEEGYITNYDEMLKYKEDYLIRVTKKYNSLSEAEQKEYKKNLDRAQEDYDNFKESMDRYTDLWSEEIPDIVEEFEDKLDEAIEINITKFNYEVELTLNLNEAKRQWNDFKRNVLLNEDDAGAIISQSYLDDMTTYEKDAFKSSEQAINIQKEIDIINAGGSSKIYGKDLTAAMDDLEKQHQASMNAVQGAKSAAEQSRQLWLSGIDDSINELNETAEVYDTLDNLYNHDMNMVTMLYGDDEYEKIDNIYKQKQANDIEELNNIKEREKHYKQMMDAETDPEAKEKWKKAWLSTINELTSKTEEAVKTVLDQHANAVKKTVEEMNEKILPKDKNGNTMSLELIGEEWDLIREEGERYLDDIEVGFGVQDFQNSFEDAFDATDSIAGQNKLNKVYQEQLDILKDKDKLSQYDLDRAQAMLDITLKEIALEEARQNKNSMRLRRDAQGNYSYQYVEDEEATKDAERDLQDAQKGLYQLDKEKYLEDVQYVYNKTKELEDKILELYNDTTLTNEEREAKKALLIDQYAPQIEAATKNVEDSKVNLGNSTKIAMGAIGDEIVKDFVGSEGVGTLPEMESGMAQFVENIGKEGGMKSILETTFSNLDIVLDNTEKSIEDIEKAAEADFDTIGIDGVGTSADGSKTKVDELKKSVNGLKTNLDDLITKEKAENEALKNLHLQADTRLNDLIGTESQLLKNIKATQDYIEVTKQAQIENAKLANSQKANPSDTAKVQTPSSAKTTPPPQKVPDVESSTIETELDDSSISSIDGKITSGETLKFKGQYFYDDSKYVKGAPVRVINASNTVFAKVLDYRPGELHPVKIEFNKKYADYAGRNSGWVDLKDVYEYKTGGLVDKTGPAWLDGTKSKPELVLNSSDTAKLLETVKILRTKTSIAKSLEQATMDRLSDKLSAEMKKMSDMMKATTAIANAKSELAALEQKVHIEADFPNVSDSREIEEAFNNLINVASQYAYRNV